VRGCPLEKEAVKRMDDAKNNQLDRNDLDDQKKDGEKDNMMDIDKEDRQNVPVEKYGTLGTR
jgi:hypothetical protein